MPSTPTRPSGRARVLFSVAAVTALLAAYWCQAVGAVRIKSVTFDELAHLTAGYSYWLTGDYRLNPENGNLPQRWAALPLLTGAWQFPDRDREAWRQSNVWGVGREFFYELGNDPDAMLLRGRAMAALLGVTLGLVTFAWSRQMFGLWGGLLSLALFAFCPTALANGALVTSDMAAALFFTASVWGLWMVLDRITPATVLFSTLALAGLFLSKMSSILIVPVALILVLVRLIAGRPLELSCIGSRAMNGRGWQAAAILGLVVVQTAVVWMAVWAAFGLRFAAFREGDEDRDQLAQGGWLFVLERPGPAAEMLRSARDHRLLPEAYLYGLAWARRYAEARSSFLNGEYSTKGRVAFFPCCFAFKTPVALFALLGLAGWAFARARRRVTEAAGDVAGLYDLTPLLAFLGVYWGAALASNLNIGHRHLLPTYPALFVLAGAGTLLFRKVPIKEGALPGTPGPPVPAPVLVQALVPVLLLIYAAESLANWPNYLTFFNVLAGGPRNGYRHLVDSSFDWGQDLPGLKRWLERTGLPSDDARVYLSYFGSGSPDYYGIVSTRLPGYFPPPRIIPPKPLTGGVYCLSATSLETVYSHYFPGRWTTAYEGTYRRLRDLMRQLETTRGNKEARAELFRQIERSKWPELFEMYEEARFARLCAFLRRREPDDRIDNSILIYRLTDAEVEQALTAPPP
jgi:hypothetical protein